MSGGCRKVLAVLFKYIQWKTELSLYNIILQRHHFNYWRVFNQKYIFNAFRGSLMRFTCIAIEKKFWKHLPFFIFGENCPPTLRAQLGDKLDFHRLLLKQESQDAPVWLAKSWSEVKVSFMSWSECCSTNNDRILKFIEQTRDLSSIVTDKEHFKFSFLLRTPFLRSLV